MRNELNSVDSYMFKKKVKTITVFLVKDTFTELSLYFLVNEKSFRSQQT